MFLVNDSIEDRHQRIRSFIAKVPTVAVILSTADFEWTTRRAVLALGRSPTKVINQQFRSEKLGGLSALKKLWQTEVKPRLGSDLATVVPDWQYLFEKAFDLRNKLIHGVQGSVGVDYAQKRVEAILAATKAVAEYAEQNKGSVYKRKIVRLKARA